MSAVEAPPPVSARVAVAIRQEALTVEDAPVSTVWQRVSEVAGVVALILFVAALVVAS